MYIQREKIRRRGGEDDDEGAGVDTSEIHIFDPKYTELGKRHFLWSVLLSFVCFSLSLSSHTLYLSHTHTHTHSSRTSSLAEKPPRLKWQLDTCRQHHQVALLCYCFTGFCFTA
jgi:hypothetical protein